MALYDDPPMQATIYGPPTSSRDSAGGTNITWGTVRQSGVSASINTLSGSEIERFAQMGLTVSHRVGVLSSKLSNSVQVGDKIVADDTGESYHVKSIERGRAYGGVPSFTYLNVEQLLL